MIKKYPLMSLLLIAGSFLMLVVASCKKDSSSSGSGGSSLNTPTTATPKTLGVYEADSSIYKLLFMVISKVGTQTVDDGLVFDTGSGGMVLDANGLIPKSMITSTGFNITDSVVVNGITITSRTSIVQYGDDN